MTQAATRTSAAKRQFRGRHTQGWGAEFTPRLVGVITGLPAAVITSLAVLRPPWPDVSGWSAQGR